MENTEKKVNIVETVNVENASVESAPVESASVESVPAEIANQSLPEIQSGDKKVLLCVKDAYKLYMMPAMDSTTMIIEGCKFYLEHDGLLMIGAEHELSIPKDRLLRASDHAILGILNKYAVNFTEDDLKRAFERAKRFVEKMTEMVSYRNSLTIQEAYIEVIQYAKHKAGQEYLNGHMERNCKYDDDGKIVSIRDSFLQTILDEIGSGYTKVVFCKKLSMVAQHYGKELIISNKGRYTFNETGNVRWYKLRIVDEWLNKDKGGSV